MAYNREDIIHYLISTATMSSEQFKEAHENHYIDPYPNILLETIDQYTPNKCTSRRYYNRSFSIVQSSGMGKSRLVKESAMKRFTFSFNLREDMDIGSGAYPPSDKQVKNYLTTSFRCYLQLSPMIRLYVFLETLFSEATKWLEERTLTNVALEWFNWMNEKSTSTDVGENRFKFYHDVIYKAKKSEVSILDELIVKELALGKSTPEKLKPEDLKTKELELQESIIKICQGRLVKAAETFLICLEKKYSKRMEGFLATVYFDEAHTLHEAKDSNQYFALMQVLNTLVGHRIFFIFLSTNPILNTFRPTNVPYPSIRLPESGDDVIPPFFELPFDCYCTDEERESGELRLDGVCELGYLVKFGRPMWKSYYQALKLRNKHRVIELARLKFPLTEPTINYNDYMRSLLAALDCRVLLQYDQSQPASQNFQDSLVKSYMRVVFNIPENRRYMWSGYPSEPMLAEAAALLIDEAAERLTENFGRVNKSYHLINLIPKVLNYAIIFRISAGKQDKVIIRTLFTIAHDLTIEQQHPNAKSNKLRFHRPIRLLNLLKNLFSEECWEIIKSATPRDAHKEDPTLEKAFEDAWVNFSHFVHLGDYESFELNFISELLKRGAAVKAFNNQANWDGTIPYLMGDLATTPIDYKNTGIILFQDKNAKTDKIGAPTPPPINNDTNKLPVLPIVFDLGAEAHTGPLVTVDTKWVGSDTAA